MSGHLQNSGQLQNNIVNDAMSITINRVINLRNVHSNSLKLNNRSLKGGTICQIDLFPNCESFYNWIPHFSSECSN